MWEQFQLRRECLIWGYCATFVPSFFCCCSSCLWLCLVLILSGRKVVLTFSTTTWCEGTTGGWHYWGIGGGGETFKIYLVYWGHMFGIFIMKVKRLLGNRLAIIGVKSEEVYSKPSSIYFFHEVREEGYFWWSFVCGESLLGHCHVWSQKFSGVLWPHVFYDQ